MTEIKSKTVEVNKRAEDLFDMLSDFGNFKSIMPDSVNKFEADENSFLFGMSGMPEVRLVLSEKQRPNLIKLKAASSKLDFELNCHIEAIDDSKCRSWFEFQGNFNPMLRMMVERPLKNFIEQLSDKLAGV